MRGQAAQREPDCSKIYAIGGRAHRIGRSCSHSRRTPLIRDILALHEMLSRGRRPIRFDSIKTGQRVYKPFCMAAELPFGVSAANSWESQRGALSDPLGR